MRDRGQFVAHDTSSKKETAMSISPAAGTEVRLCRECRWSRPDWVHLVGSLSLHGYWRFACCMHPAARQDMSHDQKIDILVTGSTRQKPAEQHLCMTVRKVGDCGEDGRLWEPRR
jgi:hypothetical protein